MRSEKKYTIRTKLYFLVFVFLVGLIFCDVSSFWLLRVSRVNGPYYNQIEESRELYNDITFPDLVIIKPILISFKMVNESDPERLKLLEARFKAEESAYRQSFERWDSKLGKDAEQRNMLEKSYKLAVSFFDIWYDEFFPEISRKNSEKARGILVGPMLKLYDEHAALLAKLSDLELQENTVIENEVETLFKYSLALLIASWALVLIFGVLLAYLISRSIKIQMSDVISALTSISTEISSKMDQQGQNVMQQSHSVHESTKTIDEINNSFKQTEALAHESSSRAKNALKLSEEGNRLLKTMIDGLMGLKNKVLDITNQINSLRDFVHQIHNITLVTSNLTNQTNILALNAAVQAAHAKDQSAGFSVIATEIRKLADESKKFLTNIDAISESIRIATDSTMSLAEEGNKNVQENIQLAQNTLQSFNQLITINNSSFEGAEQVKQNVERQSEAMQQIAVSMGLLSKAANHTVQSTEDVRHELEKLNKVSKEISEAV